MQLSYLFRRAMDMPPHHAFYRFIRFIWRLGVQKVKKTYARKRCTFISADPNFDFVGLSPDGQWHVVSEQIDVIGEVLDRNLRHEFDMLGSGWVLVKPGYEPEGLDGQKYLCDAKGRSLPYQTVNARNKTYAEKVHSLINKVDYSEIDWRLDFRSGFRWYSDVYFKDLNIGYPLGTDIKMPWELGRLQHLVRFALASKGKKKRAYVTEIRNQILDFISANPPQFGPNWGCPMDVGIRAANMALAVSLCQSAGHIFDKAFTQELAASLRAHGHHIFNNLEWSDKGRSNHYLSDIAGLIFIATALPQSDETMTWLAVGICEMVKETQLQFNSDGSNYEGSVGYHRLSMELSIYSFALILGLSDEKKNALKTMHVTQKSSVPYTIKDDIGKEASFYCESLPDDLVSRLFLMREFLSDLSTPTDELVQIGDMDSGRFFLLNTVFIQKNSELYENVLHTQSVLEAVDALFGKKSQGLGACIIDFLTNGRTLKKPKARQFHSYSDKTTPPAALAWPEIKDRKEYFFEIPTDFKKDLKLAYYSDFGVIVWKNNYLHMTLRVAKHDAQGAPMGHTHDDNLGVTLWVNGNWVKQDLGTYVYTSLPDQRRVYQKAGAHFVPRAENWPIVEYFDDYLFDCRHKVVGELVEISKERTVAKLHADDKIILRTVELVENGIRIVDTSSLQLKTFIVPSPPANFGYGRRLQ